MRLKTFLSKRINIMLFVTVIFVLIGLLFGIVIPNTLFNNQIAAIEDNLHGLVDNHQKIFTDAMIEDPEERVIALDSTQVLYEYEDGESTTLTSSGFIEIIDENIEHHLIHWSHEQIAEDIQAILYEDDFQNKHYIYYVYVVDDENYVVSYEDTKEVIMFVDSFRSTSLVAVFVFYVLSLLFSSTIFNSSLIRQYSLFDPVTNLNTKVSLYNKYNKKDLVDYKITYFNIYNLDTIVEAIGARNNEDVLKTIAFNISKHYHSSIYQVTPSEYILLDELHGTHDEIFNKVINEKVYPLSQQSAYEFKVKTIQIDSTLLVEVDISTLIKQFSFAFSKIKSSKKSSYFVNKELVEEMEKEQYYQSRLSGAIKNGNIINFYQPKVDPKTNTVIGAEALSRWRENDTIISPANYIHLAEANGLIYDIDLISFNNTLQFIKELEENNLLEESFKVSTNFSPISLKNITSKQIRDLIEASGVNPKNISIEITESVVLEFDVIEELLKDLSEYGITIEIDDFSAGNSSFTMLSFIKANVVKLDRAILPENKEDEREKLIYHSLVDISKKLDLKIISEGVETEDQKIFVRDLGVEGVQGYFYSKPLNSASFIKYLNNNE